MSIAYNKTGINGNQIREADLYLTEQLVTHLSPNKEGLYLDIGCGTGTYTHALHKKGFQFIGMDPSIEMLKRALSVNKEIPWKIGSAEKTDLPKASIDGIIATLTIQHWSNLTRAFSELNYILKPKGKIVLFTTTPQQIKGYWLNHYFPKMLQTLIVQMPSLQTIENAFNYSNIKIAKTESYNITPDLKDPLLYCGKHNPELYFNESIQHYISSHNTLSHLNELKTGLHNLRADINSGRINDIITSYTNDFGDYLYIIAEKTTL